MECESPIRFSSGINDSLVGKKEEVDEEDLMVFGESTEIN